jgi:hypothetical protein
MTQASSTVQAGARATTWPSAAGRRAVFVWPSHAIYRPRLSHWTLTDLTEV